MGIVLNVIAIAISVVAALAGVIGISVGVAAHRRASRVVRECNELIQGAVGSRGTVDPHALFFAENVVWKTLNGGKSWTQISPDLTRTDSIVPPNVGGFPDGTLLLGPHQLVHTFDLLDALPAVPAAPAGTDELLARFGLFDVGHQTRAVLRDARDDADRFALAAMSPEFAVL